MDYLPYLAALGLTVGFAWLISNIGSVGGPIDRMVGAIASLVGGYRPDGWPLGVQEEDRDRPWGSGPASAEDPDETPAVELSRVAPAIRARL